MAKSSSYSSSYSFIRYVFVLPTILGHAMVELEGSKYLVKIDKNYKIQDAYSYDDTVSLKILKD